MPTCKEAALEDWQLGADGRKVPTSCSVPGPHAWTYAGQWSLKKRLDLCQSLTRSWFPTFGRCWLCSPSCCLGTPSVALPCSCWKEKSCSAFSPPQRIVAMISRQWIIRIIFAHLLSRFVPVVGQALSMGLLGLFGGLHRRALWKAWRYLALMRL